MSGVKSHYSCAELAALRLPGYPASERRFKDVTEREGWPFREVKSAGKNGTRREYAPPKGVRELIFKHLLEQEVKHVKAQIEAGPSSEAGAAIAATAHGRHNGCAIGRAAGAGKSTDDFSVDADGAGARARGRRRVAVGADVGLDQSGRRQAVSGRSCAGRNAIEGNAPDQAAGDVGVDPVNGSGRRGGLVLDADGARGDGGSNIPVSAGGSPARVGTAALNDKQRLRDASRAVIFQFIGGYPGSQQAAIRYLNAAYRDGLLHPDLVHAIENSNDKPNEERLGKLSRDTLNKWKRIKGTRGSFASKVIEKDLSTPTWGPALLARYRVPQRVCLAMAVKQACEDLRAAGWGEDDLPSETQARRWLKKLPVTVLEHGRATGAAWAALRPCVRRDWSGLNSNDVWVGDGHTFKAKVQHPDHGRPFAPEVTLVIDAASRYVVGWTVSLAENCIAVAEALGHGMSRCGKPLIYYSDNGAGQTAKVLDAAVTGILARLGVAHETGIPGNPQGRGLIERVWQTLTIPLARTFPTCQTKTMDKETLNKATRAINSAKARGEVPAFVPSWKQFIEALDAAIADYNANHQHRSLGGATPASVYAAKLDPLTSVPLSADEVRELFRPEVERSTARGEVKLFNNTYYLRDLADLKAGTKVRVSYDIHDPSQVWIKDMDGRLIGVAAFEGNTKDGFAKPYMQRLKEQRVADTVQRRMEQIETARAELNATIEMQALEALEADWQQEWEEREAAALVGAVLAPVVNSALTPTLSGSLSDSASRRLSQGEREPGNVVALRPERQRPTFFDDLEQLEWLANNPQAMTEKDFAWMDWLRGESAEFARHYRELFQEALAIPRGRGGFGAEALEEAAVG
ncbi:MAG: hypothetical protein EPN21_07880 [Methylococcaceae bacterium]|nr:MAG: hypothetical protein EPN21_07880 [Methylococcaceae bacterium]